MHASGSLRPLGYPPSPSCKPVSLPGPGNDSGLSLAQLGPLQQNLPEQLNIRSLPTEAGALLTQELDVAELLSTANPLKLWSSSADLQG